MNGEELRARQAPWKALYRERPEEAVRTLKAEGSLDTTYPGCRVTTEIGPVEAGLHPAAGGDGTRACPGDMLLQALVGCAGVTLTAVATALGITLRGGKIEAEGDLDFRGTLGVDKTTPVGFTAIRLRYQLDTDADEAQVAKLLELTERYCVVAQTIHKSTPLGSAAVGSDESQRVAGEN